MPAGLSLRLGAIFAGLAVALGALGAHALQHRCTATELDQFEKAVRYQFFHALALLLCASFADQGRRTGPAAWAFVTGIALFCGGLYGLVFTGWRPFAHMTPFGGIAFLVGWAALAALGPRRAP